MSITIRDVARLAGVSHTTVSNVLNNIPKVGRETRQRVLKAMEDLGFEPSLVAKSLYTKRSYMVGYMMPAITNEFFMSVARGAERVLYRENISLFLCDTMLDPQRENDYMQRLIRHRVDGVLFNYAASEKSIRSAIHAGIPVVAIESPVNIPGISLVEVDNAAAAMMGVEYLINLGHRRISVIALDYDSVVNQERLRGFHKGLKVRDLRPRPELEIALSTLGLDNGYFDRVLDLAQSPLPAHREFAKTIGRLLALADPPSAFFCFDYQSAIITIRCLSGLGVKPGQDISVMGFDCSTSACFPCITSIAQPAGEMGALAAELLLERVNNSKTKPRSLRLSAQLIAGETTGRV